MAVQSSVYFAITVHNTGNVDLTNLVITDVSTAYGGSTKTLYTGGALTADAIALGATISGDTGNDNVLSVGETWTILYSQPFEFGQHVNTASVTDTQGATDSDAAYYYGIAPGPGVRTPGFWSNLGAQFWDGISGNETKSGPTFAKGELLYAVDSNHDGVIDGADKAGLLVGDYNHNGKTDAGEDTLFIGFTDARNLINASQKTQAGDGVQMLGRDLVATWLNYLAGNPIGDGSDTNSPHHYIDDAVNWLQTFGDAGSGNTWDPTEKFDTYAATHGTVKTSSAFWNQPQVGDSHTAGLMHGELDYYNNTGDTYDPSNPAIVYNYASSADADAALINASQGTV